MSCSDDIAVRLVAQGLATAVGKDVFLGSKAALPSLRENIGPYVSLIDTGGTAAVGEHNGRYPQPSLQVVVRAQSSSIAKAKAEAIHADVCDLANVTINGRFYLRIRAVQEVLDMQVDEVGRARFGFNINMLCRQ